MPCWGNTLHCGFPWDSGAMGAVLPAGAQTLPEKISKFEVEHMMVID